MLKLSSILLCITAGVMFIQSASSRTNQAQGMFIPSAQLGGSSARHSSPTTNQAKNVSGYPLHQLSATDVSTSHNQQTHQVGSISSHHLPAKVASSPLVAFRDELSGDGKDRRPVEAQRNTAHGDDEEASDETNIDSEFERIFRARELFDKLRDENPSFAKTIVSQPLEVIRVLRQLQQDISYSIYQDFYK